MKNSWSGITASFNFDIIRGKISQKMVAKKSRDGKIMLL